MRAAPRSLNGVTRMRAMHLRSPSVDRGVQSFIWAVVFFLVLYLGMVAIEVSKATALVLSLVVAFLVFLLVRTRGEPDPRDQR
jgi:purine-cytosine permease-like protein